MTFEALITIRCELCPASFTGERLHSLYEVRRAAERHGWAVDYSAIPANDYCPQHKAKP